MALVTDELSSGSATRTFPGGYFALPINIGDHSRTAFAVVPEIKFNLGYRVTPAATFYVGYGFLYASKVARPGNQINRNINPTQSVSYVGDVPANLDGTAQPAFKFNTFGGPCCERSARRLMPLLRPRADLRLVRDRCVAARAAGYFAVGALP